MKPKPRRRDRPEPAQAAAWNAARAEREAQDWRAGLETAYRDQTIADQIARQNRRSVRSGPVEAEPDHDTPLQALTVEQHLWRQNRRGPYRR